MGNTFFTASDKRGYDRSPDVLKPDKKIFKNIREGVRSKRDKENINKTTASGAGLGGLAGAAIGSRFGSGKMKLLSGIAGGLAGMVGGGALTRSNANKTVDSSYGINSSKGTISPTAQKARNWRTRNMTGMAIADMKTKGGNFGGSLNDVNRFNMTHSIARNRFEKAKKSNPSLRYASLYNDKGVSPKTVVAINKALDKSKEGI